MQFDVVFHDVCVFSQAFAPPGWHQGMTRETFLAMVNTFFSAGKVSPLSPVNKGDHCVMSSGVCICLFIGYIFLGRIYNE